MRLYAKWYIPDKKIWVKTASGWQEAKSLYIKTANGWQEATEFYIKTNTNTWT